MNKRDSTRTALVITHVPFEDLGSLGIELTHAGPNIQGIDACTADLRAVDALEPDLMVVLGGPVGVYQSEAYPFIEVEKHPEVTVQGLERWYVGHASELGQAGICVRRLREESRTFGPELEIAAKQVWQQWLDQLFGLTG
jgi:GMP synthase-like glutamine amidotransferase